MSKSTSEEFQDKIGLRAASGFVGLKNFGCTCYMNSLLQQLFMIPDIWYGILSSDPILDAGESLEENVLFAVQLIFSNLLETEKQYYAPDNFIKAFKFYGEDVNVWV